MVGGWVKSSKEVRKDIPAPAPLAEVEAPEAKDVKCGEIMRTRIPLFRSIMRAFGGGHYTVRDKIDSVVPKQLPPSFSILQVSDGSTVATLQVLVDSAIAAPSQILHTGTCILVEGVLQQPLVQGKHAIELKVEKVLHIGTVDQSKYPLSKKRLPLEMLRDFSHFRPRTTAVASVTRIRNTLNQATHIFFMNNGFLYVQLPIITATNIEGTSEKFQVTALLGNKNIKKFEPLVTDDSKAISLETIKASIVEKSKQVEELKRTESNKEALATAIQDLHKTNELVAQLEARERFESVVSVKSEKVDFSGDYFSRETYLTISGRLHLESYACALGNVYSYGPRFRAEKFDSKRQVAEMWMVEIEMAFSKLEDAMNCAEDFLKFVTKYAAENCTEDLKFLSKRVNRSIVDHLQSMSTSSFHRISFAEAIEALKQVKDTKFEADVQWGSSLTEEHESYLVEEIYNGPVIIHNHPKEIKPFYVRMNSDGKTVAAFDVIVPKIGTIIRGSQNEERVNMLMKRIKESGLPKDQFEWYLDLRRHGTVTHSGFSLAFDLLSVFATGLVDVKDVIPFPRSHGKVHT